MKVFRQGTQSKPVWALQDMYWRQQPDPPANIRKAYLTSAGRSTAGTAGRRRWLDRPTQEVAAPRAGWMSRLVTRLSTNLFSWANQVEMSV